MYVYVYYFQYNIVQTASIIYSEEQCVQPNTTQPLFVISLITGDRTEDRAAGSVVLFSLERNEQYFKKSSLLGSYLQ